MINLHDYIIKSGQFKTLKIDELLLVEYKCLINEKHSEIWSHTNYLGYVIGGEKKWKTPSGESKVKSGEALFVKKGAHTVYQYFDEPFLVLFIFIPDEFIRSVIVKHQELRIKNLSKNHSDQNLLKISINPVLQSFFQSLMSFFTREASYSKSILKLKLEELVLNILTQPENNSLKQYFFQLCYQQKRNIAEIMNAHYSSPLSINDYARLSARSISTFRRDFKEVFNESPGKWLTNKRLEYGKFLLETTDLSLSEIMEKSGFKNRSHFLKSFKQVYQISPARHRSKSIAIEV